MNPRFLLATLALLSLGAILYYGVTPHGDSKRRHPGDDATPGAPAGKTDVAVRSPEANGPTSGPADRPVTDPDAALEAEQRVRDLEAVLALAEQRLTRAERGLAASEAEVEELEQIIADIKGRGEDPADYSDLALERFQPAFFRYQDAQAAYDRAERLAAEAGAALEAARAEVARHRSSDRTE